MSAQTSWSGMWVFIDERGAADGAAPAVSIAARRSVKTNRLDGIGGHVVSWSRLENVIDRETSMDARPTARMASGSVIVSYALFVLVGLGAGVGTVLLPAQMADYGVNRATVGLTFFPFSAGFVLAGIATG